MANQGKDVYFEVDGEFYAMPEEKAQKYIEAGFSPLTEGEVGKRLAIEDAEESGVLGAFGKSALASATYSLSDLAYSDEEIAARNELYPISSTLGSIAGAIPALALAVKTGGAAPAAATAVGKTAVKAGLAGLGGSQLAAQAALKEGVKGAGRKAISALAAPGAAPGRMAAAKAAEAGLGKTAQGLAALGTSAFAEGAIYSGIESGTRQIKNFGVERVTDDFLAYSGETIGSALYGGAASALVGGALTGTVKGAGLLSRYYQGGAGDEKLARFMLSKVKDQKAREAAFEKTMQYTRQVEGLKDSLFRLKDVETRLKDRVNLGNETISALQAERQELLDSVATYKTELKDKSGLKAAQELEAQAFDALDAAAKKEALENTTAVAQSTLSLSNAFETAADVLGERSIRQGAKRAKDSPRIKIQNAILRQPGEFAENAQLKAAFEIEADRLANELGETAKSVFGFVPKPLLEVQSKLRRSANAIKKKTVYSKEAGGEVINDLSGSHAVRIMNDIRAAKRQMQDFSKKGPQGPEFTQQIKDFQPIKDFEQKLKDFTQNGKFVGEKFAASERATMNALSAKLASASQFKGILGKSVRRGKAPVGLEALQKKYGKDIITPEGMVESRVSYDVRSLKTAAKSMIEGLQVALEDVKYLPARQQARVAKDIQKQIDNVSAISRQLAKENQQTLAYNAAAKDLKSVTGRSAADKDVRGKKIDQALFRLRLQKESDALVQAAEDIASSKDVLGSLEKLKKQAQIDADAISDYIAKVSKRMAPDEAILKASEAMPSPRTIAQRIGSGLATGAEIGAYTVLGGQVGAAFGLGRAAPKIRAGLSAAIPSIRKEDPIKALARAATVVSVVDQTTKRIAKLSNEFTANMARVQPTTRVFDRRVQRSALAKILGASVLRQKTLDDIPTDEEVTAMVEAIDEQGRNIESTLESIQETDGNPELIDQTQRRVAATARYLQENKPQAANAGPFAKSSPRYSLAERKRMATISNVINDPLNTFYANLDANTLNSDTLEVLEAVYPDLATRLQTALMEGVAESETPVPYSKRVMFGRLYGDYFEPTTNTNNIQMLQLNPGSQQGKDQDKLNAAPLKQMPAAQPSAIDRVSGN